MRYGINLWGVWNLLSADPAGFCGKVREMGYQYLEPCITVGRGIEGLPQFMDEEALTQFINTAKAHDLKVEAAHVAVTDEANAVQIMLKQAETLGIRQFVFKCPPTLTEEELGSYAQRLISYADALSEAGATILLHNGGEDIAAKIGGVSAYEWLLEKCGGKVFAEPDVGWMMYGAGAGNGGEDPETFLWKNEKYVRAMHYKDFAPGEDGNWKERPVGQGLADVDAIFRFSRAAEVIQYVDGKPGVYVRDGSVVRFRRITVLYEGDGYVIAEERTAKEARYAQYSEVLRTGGDEAKALSYLHEGDLDFGDFLNLNDQIITYGRNLYDGKILK